MKRLTIIIFGILLFVFPIDTQANENQFVTIVNPVRIAPYTIKSSESIKAEYAIIQQNKLPATWLLTYDILEDNDALNIIATFDQTQELGLFLEVTPSLCKVANVTCNEGSWHHADVIFFSGYSQGDRRKFIDALFTEFKDEFGYYPKAVGSWWTDSYSLSYMKEKYDITSNLICSDQFATDGYQLWGSYWMKPFYSSKIHTGISAKTIENQLDVVTIQWAPRDPLNGYKSSLYSAQDYQTAPLSFTTDYFEKLIKTYGYAHYDSFGQITVGLEGDYNANDYQGEYANQISRVKKLTDTKDIQAVTMSSFGEWYRSSFEITPSSFIVEDDYLGSSKKAFWYSSAEYRIGMTYDPRANVIQIIDFRIFTKDFQEPYFFHPNKQHQLSINNPSIIDTMQNQNSSWEIELSDFQSVSREGNTVTIHFENGSFRLEPDTLHFEIGDDTKIPSSLRNNPFVQITRRLGVLEIKTDDEFIVPQEGYTFRALTEVGIRELTRKRTKAVLMVISILYLVFSILVIRSTSSTQKKFLFLAFAFLPFFLSSTWWYSKNSERYSVSQSEIDVLSHLAQLPKGRVLVYDKECLGCEWNSKLKPAVYANRRSYVSKFGKSSIVQSKEFFLEKDLEKAKQIFNQLNTDYIYLVTYEDLHEVMPFSPGDFHIELVYKNANGELWRVKD